MAWVRLNWSVPPPKEMTPPTALVVAVATTRLPALIATVVALRSEALLSWRLPPESTIAPLMELLPLLSRRFPEPVLVKPLTPCSNAVMLANLPAASVLTVMVGAAPASVS